MDIKETEVGYIAGTPYVGAEVLMKAGPGGNRGEFTAWDINAGKRAVVDQGAVLRCGAARVVTAGDVAFYGTMDGWFKAVDANTGALLWQFKTGSGIIGQPTTWRGPDGKQYVGVVSGVGGWAGAIVAGDLDPRDGTAALGFVNAMTDLPKFTTKGGTLYVFCASLRRLSLLLADWRSARRRRRASCASAPTPTTFPSPSATAAGFENKIAALLANEARRAS